jgi:cellulose synthase/poly-beta-1,6-N-acetylglucosamine synthase-like glycosyltransferase
MSLLISFLLTAIVLALAVPTAVFAVEILAALLWSRRIREAPPIMERHSRLAVLIPAHNEAKGLLATLNDIRSQLRPSDRLLVVADNCTDETAAIAASVGAEVTVRTDPARIGKGYALDWGLNVLARDPPETVVMIDADCRLAERAIDCLVSTCERSQRPVQSLYLMTSPTGPTINQQVAEFAWRVKNWVRPLGLCAMSLPCQLMGSGMAFPWDVIRSADLYSGFIVEDLKLGLELAEAGHAPIFCPSAVVTSNFPASAQSAKTQRHRWEQGHLGLILTKAPKLLFSAVRRRNKNLLALTLDLIVPPYTLLLALPLATLVLGATITALSHGTWYPLAISLISIVLMVSVTVFAWVKYGRDILPVTSFILIGRYLRGKSNLYRTALSGERISRWIRTDRT